VALVREDGQRVYLSDVGIMDRFDEALLRRHLEQLGACDFVLLTGLFSITGLALPGVGRVFAELRARGVVTLLDTGWHMEGWPEAVRGDLRGLLRETDYVLPNLEEIAGMTNATGRPEALLRALREAGARGIFLKLGEAGAAGLIGEEMMAAAAVPIVPRNTTAAGECFNAGVLHGLAQGWLPAAVLSFANRLAAHYVATGEYAAEAAVPPEPTP
jgi:sugar/nucleoside kinase (ribokinase family)